MATFLPGTRTLTLQITDPEVGDSISCYVYLTSDSAGNNVVGTAGTATAAQTSNGSAQTFAPQVSVASAGTYYGWVAVLKNGALYAVFAQTNTLTIGNITVSQGAWS
jgi:hypothetical protein